MTIQRVIFIVAIVILGYCGWGFLKNSQRFPIHTVQVNASYEHVKPHVYREIIMPFLNSSFFAINVTELERALVKEAWIQHVDIKRIWPDVIALNIYEQTPSAYWNKNKLIDSRGVVFSPVHLQHDMDLPSINGPKEWSKKLWQQYKIMNEHAQLLGLVVGVLTVNDRHSWQVTLVNAKQQKYFRVILGRDKVEQRWARFLKSYKKLIKNKKKIDVIDLRYPSGFSVI